MRWDFELEDRPVGREFSVPGAKAVKREKETLGTLIGHSRWYRFCSNGGARLVTNRVTPQAWSRRGAEWDWWDAGSNCCQLILLIKRIESESGLKAWGSNLKIFRRLHSSEAKWVVPTLLKTQSCQDSTNSCNAVFPLPLVWSARLSRLVWSCREAV